MLVADEDYNRLIVDRDRARQLVCGLFSLIDRDTWRSTGGDDQQGHYEGDYRAEKIAEEIRSWASI